MATRGTSLGAAIALGSLAVLTISVCDAQPVAISPPNPEFIEYMDARLRGAVPTVSESGHGLGDIPPPALHEGLQIKPRGIPLVGQPATYDLRNVPGKLPAIRDQGACGSCWAFGAFSSLESCLRPADTADFSESHLKNLHGFDWSCCSGGNAWLSCSYLARWEGPVYESDDPYSYSCSSPPGLSPRRHVQEVIWLPLRSGPADNDTIKNAVMNYGAVYVNYYHSDTYYNSTYHSYYHPTATSTNHGVAIVGWDDNFPASQFSTPAPGNGAFIIRNSWGTGWGENGYFYMSYYDNRCGYSSLVAFLNAESSANYTTQYSYDPLGWVWDLGQTGVYTYWGANVFTKGGSAQRLSAVGLYTTAPNANYEVRIYRNPTSGPTGGNPPVHTQMGSFSYAGFHTVTLSPPVDLASTDTSFSVVTKMTTPLYDGPQAVELRWAGYSSAASASPGQSYYSADGALWTDLTTWDPSANFCIKAYTRPGNNAPTDPTTCSISPPSPKTNADLTATAGGSADPDPGDIVTYVYQWAKSTTGGASWGLWGDDGQTLDHSNTAKGQLWKARARASDGKSYSANWRESSPVTIGNTAPTDPTTVGILPVSPTSSDDLIGSASGSTDADSGDTLTYRFQWAKAPTAGGPWGTWGNGGPTLDASKTTRGEWWKARGRAYDGTDYSSWVETSPVMIGNSPPTDPAAASISPLGPPSSSNLTASASGSSDTDSDPVSYEYQWAKSTNQGGTWSGWGWDGQILGSANTADGDWWKAHACAYDGTDHSGWVESGPVEIGNNVPTDPTTCSITPPAPETEDDLTGSAGGSTDPDAGDTVTYQFEWASSPDGSTWSSWGHGGNPLDSSNTVKGQYWKARARAFDGVVHSGWLESSPVTIVNSEPSDPATVSVSPTSPDTNDDLTASASGSTDPDPSDTVIYEYQWAKRTTSGSSWEPWGNYGAVLPASNTTRDEQWKARGRAYDGIAWSNWVQSAPVTIGNSAPTDPATVSVSPTAPSTGDALTASAGGSTDADGDSVAYRYQWARSTDGGTSWDAWGDPGAKLDATRTSKGELWKARSRATDGTDRSAWVESAPVSIENSSPEAGWLGTAGYVSDGVDPDAGAPDSTRFTFAVRITDPDDTAPRRVRVYIYRLQDGRKWVFHRSLRLRPTSGSAWCTGMVCTASARLPNGCYRYRFRARDDLSARATGAPTRWSYGPNLNAEPQLWCTALPGRTKDFVEPNKGAAGNTTFCFAVQYSDGEGNLPQTGRIVLQRRRKEGTWGPFGSADMKAWGGDPRTGKYYAWKKELPAGEYRHRFIFEDEDGTATGAGSTWADATRWQIGPVVSEGTADAACSSGALISSLSAAPSAMGAQITISLTSAAQVDARVINVAGRPVKTICRAVDCEAGANTLLWNAQSDTGLSVPNGVYLIEVVAKAPEGPQTRALAQVRIGW